MNCGCCDLVAVGELAAIGEQTASISAAARNSGCSGLARRERGVMEMCYYGWTVSRDFCFCDVR
jgi:hypothetical protein